MSAAVRTTGTRTHPAAVNVTLGAMVPNRVGRPKMGIAISLREVFYREDGARCSRLRIRSALADFLPVEFIELGECVLELLSAKDSAYFRLERINTNRIDLSHRLRPSRSPKNVRGTRRGASRV
jgi:hypothetical protein